MQQSPIKPKTAALFGVVCAYVAAGYAAYHAVHVLTGNADLANTFVAALALPLAIPLYAAIEWIDSRF